MYRIDNANAVPHASGVPTPAAAGPNPNGYFTKGNPATATAATIVDDDWCNAVQEELSGFAEAAGITLDKTNRAQMLAAARLMFPVHGQCRLSVVSTTQIKLAPFNGNVIRIAGVPYFIPSAGITISNAGLSASTLYYVYAYNSAGSPALELSTTGHATDTTAGNIGVEVKSGGASRTLVGMVYMDGSAHFVDGATQRLCANWFNRRSIVATVAALGASTTSTGFFDLFPSNHISILTWSDEAVSMRINGAASNDTGGQTTTTAVAVDGSVVGTGCTATAAANNASDGANADYVANLAEGLHVLQIDGKVSGGNATWGGMAMFATLRG